MQYERPSIVVLGAGPAGLGAAFKLAARGRFTVTVIERNNAVGGNAGSFELSGLRVDYGSHRLHPSCAPSILADLRAMLNNDLLDRPRHGRILLRGHWVHFPLKPANLITHLPASFAIGVAEDSIRKLAGRNGARVDSFEDVLKVGLGKTICNDFYFPYAQKIWGVSPDELDAEQARRRVSAGSLGKMIRRLLNAVPGMKPNGAGRFFYPKNGFGAISDAYYCAALKAGADIRLGTSVVGIDVNNRRITAVRIQDADGERALPARQVLSTIPISLLAKIVSPTAPQPVLNAANALRFRSMLLIYLVLETDRFTEYDAHYFPGSDIPITRLSEPKNYSGTVLPGRTVLCAELPCSQNDSVWTATNEELSSIVRSSLSRAGLPLTASVREVAVRRLPHAYPIYMRDYHRHFDAIDSWFNSLEGIVTFGRQGLFAHDNTHHALNMAYAVDECLNDYGSLDTVRWARHRTEFQKHVVED